MLTPCTSDKLVSFYKEKLLSKSFENFREIRKQTRGNDCNRVFELPGKSIKEGGIVTRHIETGI